MAKTAVILSGILAVANGAAHGGESVAYPAAFPYENESYEMPEIPPVGTINFLLNDDDGGYLRTAYDCDVDALFGESEYFSIADQCYAYYGWVAKAYSYASAAEYKSWISGASNCSQTWNENRDEIENENGYNIVGGETICSGGTCCKSSFADGAKGFTKNVAQYQDVVASFVGSGGCDIPTEVSYCTLLLGAYSNNCYIRYLSPGTRFYITPCFDAMVQWFRTCGTFQLTGMPYRNYEPEKYWNALSPEQSMTGFSLFYAYDRVCQPYSYYFPDTAKEDTGDSPAPAGDSRASGHIRQTSVSPSSCQDLGCDYECSKEYDVTTVGSDMTLAPTSSPSGCTCHFGTGTVSGNVASGSFPDGTTFVAQGSGDGIDVIVAGACTGKYSVTSGEVLGVDDAGDSSAATHHFCTLLVVAVAFMFAA